MKTKQTTKLASPDNGNMEKKLQDEITGRWYSTCQFWKCKNKCFKVYTGIIMCRKHFKTEMIKNYGSLKRAKKYVK